MLNEAAEEPIQPASRVSAIQRHPRRLLVLLFGAALVLRLIWLWWPQGAAIFDETFYVNAARVLLGRDVGLDQPYAGAVVGLDPNTEHPPLGKLLIAGSIQLLGDGGLGWRVPSVIASMVAIMALYAIVRRGGGPLWVGVAAVWLFALDNLSFVHGRIATLDMLSVAPALVGAWFALGRRWLLAGVACGVGTLVKLTAFFGLVGILFYEVARIALEAREGLRPSRSDLLPIVVLLGAYLFSTVGGLWVLDAAFSHYKDPFSHLAHMLSYGASLQAPAGLTGIASYPWQWPFNAVEIPYLRVVVDTIVTGGATSSQVTMDFRGALNPILLLAAPLGVGTAVWLTWRDRNPLALWSISWISATYLPYFVLALVSHRIMYLYYFLPVVPGICVAVALLLNRPWFKLGWRIVFTLAVLAGFLAYFPFRVLP